MNRSLLTIQFILLEQKLGRTHGAVNHAGANLSRGADERRHQPEEGIHGSACVLVFLDGALHPQGVVRRREG